MTIGLIGLPVSLGWPHLLRVRWVLRGSCGEDLNIVRLDTPDHLRISLKHHSRMLSHRESLIGRHLLVLRGSLHPYLILNSLMISRDVPESGRRAIVRSLMLLRNLRDSLECLWHSLRVATKRCSWMDWYASSRTWRKVPILWLISTLGIMRHPLTWVYWLDEIVPHLRLLIVHLVLGGVKIGSYIGTLMLIQPRGWHSIIVHSLTGLRTLLITHIVWILLLKLWSLSKVILWDVVPTLYSLGWRRHHMP